MQRVLIVDDDEMVRAALREFLEAKGYHLADAESGPLALALFPLFKPDAVLLDILMPGMDGIEVLQRMKPLKPDVRIIMLTAVAMDDVAQEAMKNGADDYLTKPIETEQLLTCLSTHLLMAE